MKQKTVFYCTECGNETAKWSGQCPACGAQAPEGEGYCAACGAKLPVYGLITAAIILYNFAGVWAMARLLLPKIFGQRGKALVNAVDGWVKPKKA